MQYPVNEIFHSIQGEGFHMGRPATFIRLSGCNLKCSFCDTEHETHTIMTAENIALQIKYPLVVITGGEPTLWDLRALFHAIDNLKGCHQIAIETNGTIYREWMISKYSLWLTCSPKPAVDYKVDERILDYVDEWKFVVDGCFTPSDAKQAVEQQYGMGRIWLQPESSQMNLRSKEAYNIAMQYPQFRVGCQLHKLIGVE